MLRVIAGVPSLTGLDRQACRVASRLKGTRLAPAARLQDKSIFSPAHLSTGRGSVCRKLIDKDGDFGARDPFPGEVATGFGNKQFGHSDTDHINRAPPGMEQFVGLTAKKCAPCEGGNIPKLSSDEVERLRIQVGWRLVTTEGGQQAIRHDLKAKNFKAGIDIIGRIAEVAEAEGHHPDLHLVGFQNVEVVLTTHAVGGLTLNDFIVAAKINDLDFSDVLSKRKPKFWA